MLIDNTTTFLHTFFFSNDIYSADVIDAKVDPFVVQFCLKNKMIDEIYKNGKRLYRILVEGKKVLK